LLKYLSDALNYFVLHLNIEIFVKSSKFVVKPLRGHYNFYQKFAKKDNFPILII